METFLVSLVDQLVDFYYIFDQFQEPHLPKEEVRKTIEILLQKGRIITSVENGVLLGYTEHWRINFEQLGRLVCHVEPFNVATEDIEHGPICFLSNVTVRPDFRWSKTILKMRNELFERNKDSLFFVGEANRKKENLWKCFRTSDISLNKGVLYG